MEQKSLLYDERFLESYAGSIITDPATAIVELVANCWDSYATNVEITWPHKKLNSHFVIKDNGHGMTRDEFTHIWRTIAYNRISAQGSTTPPPDGTSGQPRNVFGKNGKGRFASFCFTGEYIISSRKNGQEFTYKVSRTHTAPLVLEEISYTEKGVKGHGTTIEGHGDIPHLRFTEEQAREVIGSRFLANPAFKVSINKRPITFSDIPDLVSTDEVEVKGIGKVKILHIDTKKADKNTKQHGIAWWVQGRAVGDCKWSRSDYERVLDGRTSEAKRFTFIAQADFLNESDAILEDWSGFHDEHPTWQTTKDAVQEKIRELIFQSNSSEREEKRSNVIQRVGTTVNSLPLISKNRVTDFINQVIDTCPSFGETEIIQLSIILAKLEKSSSQYGLLELLHKCESNDYDTLHSILSDWSISMAKIVLDEIQTRLSLIHELRSKLKTVGIDEVHELQPLFERGLWMFGAQFESIEFTSNKGMTTVIQNLFGDKTTKGSRNRPDFVILPDSSVGFYARSSYDDSFDEDGIEHVVIVDLKTTGLPLGSKEKEQVWKYFKELKKKGQISARTKVDGFVLGDTIEPEENGERTDGSHVTIRPMLYETILKRAETRLLNLHKKVEAAPFLLENKEKIQAFIKPIHVINEQLIPD